MICPLGPAPPYHRALPSTVMISEAKKKRLTYVFNMVLHGFIGIILEVFHGFYYGLIWLKNGMIMGEYWDIDGYTLW